MIYFPRDLTPVPANPGYFWDTKGHKLYSIKVGGVLRELKVNRVHPAMFRYGYRGRAKTGDLYYSLSNNKRSRVMLVRDLMKLKLVDYDMPVINRLNDETNQSQ